MHVYLTISLFCMTEDTTLHNCFVFFWYLITLSSSTMIISCQNKRFYSIIDVLPSNKTLFSMLI